MSLYVIYTTANGNFIMSMTMQAVPIILSDGWSHFTSSKKLHAGDDLVFMKTKDGIVRAQKRGFRLFGKTMSVNEIR